MIMNEEKRSFLKVVFSDIGYKLLALALAIVTFVVISL